MPALYLSFFFALQGAFALPRSLQSNSSYSVVSYNIPSTHATASSNPFPSTTVNASTSIFSSASSVDVTTTTPVSTTTSTTFFVPQPSNTTTPAGFAASVLSATESSTWPGPKGPVQTLTPALNPNHDSYDLQHLSPNSSTNVYYASTSHPGSTTSHFYGTLTAYYCKPAVVLENSAFVGDVKCQPGGLHVTFTTPSAFQHAQSTWSIEETLIIVSHSLDCGNGQRSYWNVELVNFIESTRSASIQAAEIALEQALEGGDITWGDYEPTTTSASSPESTSGSSASGSMPPYYSPPSGATGGLTGNSTGAQTGNSACGVPPAPTIYGFPTAPCGDNFDTQLDETIGYLSFDNSSFSSSLEDIAPGLGDYDSDDYGLDDISEMRNSTPTKRQLSRRSQRLQKRFYVPSFLQKAVNTVSKAIDKGLDAVKSGVSTAVSGVEAGFQAVKAAAADIGFNPTIDTQKDFNIGPKSLTESPWGPAYSLFHKDKSNSAGTISGSVDLYCVSCGVQGQVHIHGAVSFSLLQLAITKGNAGVDGNLLAGLNLGMVAEASYSPPKYKTNIISQGLQPYEIPGVLLVGPEIAVDATLGFNITTEGQVLAGASMSVPNFSANLDLVDSSQSHVTGFTPQFNTNFSAGGQIRATTSLGLPVTIGVGLDIVPLKIRKLISVINEPSLEANVAYSYSTDGSGDCNNGIQYSIALADDTRLNFFDLKEVDLYNYKSPDLVSGCKLLGNNPTPTDSASRSISSDTSSSSTDGTSESGSSEDNSSPPVLPLSKRQDNSTVSLDSTGEPANAEPDDDDPNDYNPNDTTDQLMFAEANAEEDLVSSTPGQNNTDGFSFSTVPDKSGSYLLTASASGSFYVTSISDPPSSNEGVTFASYNNITISDDEDRIMHYYPDLMAAFGVSRFRIADYESLPKTADFITLVPFNYDDDNTTPNVLMAVDTQENAYYTVICNLEGQNSKIFLVKDAQAGAARLMQEDLKFIVTGGVVTDCTYLPFVGSGAGLL